MRLLRAAGIALMLLPAAVAQRIDAVAVIPATPAASQPVTVPVAGNLPDTCYSAPSTSSSVSGNTITVRLDSTVSGGGCLTVLVPYSVTANVGVLPAGAYNVTVNLYANSAPVAANSSASFTVAPAIPAASTAALVALGAGLLLLRRKLAFS